MAECFPHRWRASLHWLSLDGGWFSYLQECGDGSYCVRLYGPREWMFCSMLVFMGSLSFLSGVVIAVVFLSRRCRNIVDLLRPRRPVEKTRPSGEAPITAIIPCYLPNEQYVIEETIRWIMEHVRAPGPLTVLVVYNTPCDMPEIEGRLQDMASDTSWPVGRQFRVHRAEKSRSKAANLNVGLRMIQDPFLVIYDADHHPDVGSLELLWEKMARENMDCVQGSYYMRNLRQNQYGCSPRAFPCLARIIDAEFFLDWFFMKFVTRYFLGKGYFSGSNALWRTSVLRSKVFNESMMTEDVDMAIQQLLDGRRIDFCAESRSGELAPISLSACWKQRLRWAIGWDEVSLAHGRNMMSSRFPLRPRERFGLLWTFLARWLLTLVTICTVLVGMPVTLVYPIDDESWGKLAARTSWFSFIAGLVPCAFATFEAMLQIPHRGCQSAIQVFFVLLISSPLGFFLFFIWGLLLQITSFYKILTGTIGEWVVTERGQPFCAGAMAPSSRKLGFRLHPEDADAKIEPVIDDGEIARVAHRGLIQPAGVARASSTPFRSREWPHIEMYAVNAFRSHPNVLLNV